MARVLKNYVFPGEKRQRSPIEQWLNGKTWEITKSDYSVKPRSLMVTMYKLAKASGKKVRIHPTSDGSLIVRASWRRGRKATEQGGSHVGTQAQCR